MLRYMASEHVNPDTQRTFGLNLTVLLEGSKLLISNSK